MYHDIKKFGYLACYGSEAWYSMHFTKQSSQRIAVSFDTIETDPTADIKVLVQCEPPAIFGGFEQQVLEAQSQFDLILTYNQKLMMLPKARFFLPVDAWVSDIELNKQDQVSFLMSSKIWTPGHRMRFMILRAIEGVHRLGEMDLFFHRSPPRAPRKELFFENAKFHIACENQAMPMMFTEKILDCFRTKTIPIYYGCTNLEVFFDMRGVLKFDNIDQFKDIAHNLRASDYDRLQPYIEENYRRAAPYWTQTVYQRIEDIIEQHFKLDLN